MEDIEMEKIDMSLDDIIKLNKKTQQSTNKRGNVRGTGRGQRGNRGRGGRGGRGGQGVKGRGPNRYGELMQNRGSGVSPMNRNTNTGKKGNIQNRGRGQSNRQRKGVVAVRGRFNSRGGNRGNLRGGGTQRGRGGLRGRGGMRQGRGRGGGSVRGGGGVGGGGGVRGGARGGVIRGRGGSMGRGGTLRLSTQNIRQQTNDKGLKSIGQAKTQALKALQIARQTLQKINQQQMRMNVVNERRGIPEAKVMYNTGGTGQGRQNNKRRRWRKNSQQSSDVLTVSIDNAPRQRQRIKRRNQNESVRQEILNLKPSTSKNYSYESKIFASNTTGVSLSDRFAGQEGRKVFF